MLNKYVLAVSLLAVLPAVQGAQAQTKPAAPPPAPAKSAAAAAATDKEDNIELVGRLTGEVSFAEMKNPADLSFTALGNKILLRNLRFSSMESEGKLSKLSRVKDQVLATANAEAIITGVNQASNGRVGGADFTALEVDYDS